MAFSCKSDVVHIIGHRLSSARYDITSQERCRRRRACRFRAVALAIPIFWRMQSGLGNSREANERKTSSGWTAPDEMLYVNGDPQGWSRPLHAGGDLEVRETE